MNMVHVILGQTNSRIGRMQANLLNMWDTFDMVNSYMDRGYSDISSKDTVVNEEGRKLIISSKGIRNTG
jgi:hypothetical protein